MRRHVEARLRAKSALRSPSNTPTDITLGGGVSLSHGVGAGDRQEIGESQSVRLPTARSGQRSTQI